MHRYTEKLPEGRIVIKKEYSFTTNSVYGSFIEGKAVDKLAEYEDLEGQLNGISIKQVVDSFIETVKNGTQEGYERGRILTNAEADKWKEYEDAEKQGLLLRLPCKVGDAVYKIWSCGKNGKSIVEFEIIHICIDFLPEIEFSILKYGSHNYRFFKLSDIGKTVFLTKEEAEQKLKEMKD